MTLRATLLIPAHNEAAVIARTLRPLSGLVQDGIIAVIVIANGCTDKTAHMAQLACPGARVLQSPVPSKTHALNLGHSCAAPGLPIICLDADLVLPPLDLLSLISAIAAGAAAAIGQMQVDTAAASPLVRAYHRAWAHNPYFARGKFGGVIALGADTAAQLFPLPDVQGDDEYIRRKIDPCRVAYVPECRFTAQSPRNLRSLFATRKRARRGARQLGRLGLANPTARSGWAMLKACGRSVQGLADLAVYCAVGFALRLALALESQSSARRWERDMTTRSAGGR